MSKRIFVFYCETCGAVKIYQRKQAWKKIEAAHIHKQGNELCQPEIIEYERVSGRAGAR